VDYVEIDIESRPQAAEFVMSINHGNRTVPTVELPDGVVLTNPSIGEVLRSLRAAS
jgi:mycoredoxin